MRYVSASSEALQCVRRKRLFRYVDIRKSSVTRNFESNWRDFVVDILLAGFLAKLMVIREIAKRRSGTE